MREVGGRAAIDSGPGGTTVELTWAPESVDDRIARTWVDLTHSLSPIAAPGVVATVLMGVLLRSEIADPSLLFSGIAVVTLVGLAALRWPGPRLPPAALPVLVLAVLVGLVTNVLAVPPSTVNGHHLLMAGGVAPLLMLVAIHYPLRWSIPSLGLVWGTLAGLLWWRFGLDAITSPLVGALTGPCAVLAVVLLQGVLRWLARRTLTAQDATVRSRLRITHSELRRFDDDERLQRTRERVLPFLAAVAAGEVDPNNPGTAQCAARLEAAVREELRWGSTPGAVARAADEARSRGWQLALRLTDTQVAAHEQAVVALLEGLGPGAASGPVVVSAFGRLSAVVQSPSADRIEHWRTRGDLQIEEAEGWCRLLFGVPARADSQRRPEQSRLPV